MQWAMTQSKLGEARLAIARRDHSAADAKRAVMHLEDALEVFDPHAPAFAEKSRGLLEDARALLAELEGGGGQTS